MDEQIALVLRYILKAGGVLLVANEIRGLILAAPVLYGMYQMGGTAMSIWIGFCSLGGIVLSVVVPWLMARKLTNFVDTRQHRKATT